MKIQSITNIETSSLCNNTCEYCPAPKQGKHREVGYMSMKTFNKAMEWLKHFCDQKTQMEVNLFGIGEPTMNPHIVEMVKLARNTIYIDGKVHLNTNGNTMTMEMAQALKDAGITDIDITGHNPRSVAKTIRIFQQVGIDGKLSIDFMTSPNNWAGQVDWFEPQYTMPCRWLARGEVMILSNGDVTTCCLDSRGQGVITNVFEDITKADMSPFNLCKTCHHTLPDGMTIDKKSVLTEVV